MAGVSDPEFWQRLYDHREDGWELGAARTLQAILRPGGWLLACFYPIRGGGGGPPFPVSSTEVRELFGALFSVEEVAPPLRSVKRRGEELLMLARKTGAC